MRIRPTPRTALRTICSLLMMTAVLLPATALTQGSPMLRRKAVDADGLLAKAADPGGVRVIVTLQSATSGAGSLEPSSTQQLSTLSSAGPLGDGQVATAEQARLLAAHLGTGASKRDRWSTRLILNSPYMAMTVTDVELEALAADPGVLSIHEDGENSPTLQDSVPLIGAPRAYAWGATGGNNTMVGVLDTGVEYGHVFLSPRVTNATCFSTTNATFTTLCPNGQGTQLGGNAGINCGLAGCDHGTHVAGIAAGDRTSGTPPHGVAKDARIFVSQVFSRRNSDNAIRALDSDILAALNDLLARVSPGGELASTTVAAVNISIGDSGDLNTGNCDTGRGAPFKTVIDALRGRNVATVIAAGNDGQTNRMSFPGCVSSAISVANSTKTDGAAFDSNISATTDLFAPGSEITSSINPTPSFGIKSGTSMATPHVAGTFAAIRSAPNCGTKTVDQIETALKNTGIPIADVLHTKPRIQVNLAAKQLGCGTGGATETRDFNGDVNADILWRNTISGAVAIWLMNGTAISSPGVPGTASTDWTIAGVGDFDGNGKADILWRNTTSGAVAIWLMNGTAISSPGVPGTASTDWTIAGVGDFDGNGKADILWRNTTSGAVAIWLMNGTAISSPGVPGTAPLVWQIQ